MDLQISQATELLRQTPAVLRALLSGLSREWTHTNYGEDTFSPYDVIGHLITGEKTDWLVRAGMILQHGTTRPFDRYDRYAQFEASRGKSLDDLLGEFESLRRANLERLDKMSLSRADFERKGMHPVLGEVTLGQLLATWVAHDMNHLAQIARCMATQYEEAVGPWKEFLGILKTPVTRMDAEGAARRRAAAATSEGDTGSAT